MRPFACTPSTTQTDAMANATKTDQVQPSRQWREVTDQPDREVWLRHEQDRRERADEVELREGATDDPKHEQSGHRGEDREDVAVKRSRMAEVADDDDPEDDEEDAFEDGCDQRFHRSTDR